VPRAWCVLNLTRRGAVFGSSQRLVARAGGARSMPPAFVKKLSEGLQTVKDAFWDEDEWPFEHHCA
jgi:hypothetical protein